MTDDSWFHPIKTVLRDWPDIMRSVFQVLSRVRLKHTIPSRLATSMSRKLSGISPHSPIAFFYDVEFQHQMVRGQQEITYPLEIGGILFARIATVWWYLANFHMNCPIVGPFESLRVFQSKYVTVSPSTSAALADIEKQYLFGDSLDEATDSATFAARYNLALQSNMARRRGLRSILWSFRKGAIQTSERSKIVKKFKGIAFTLSCRDIGRHNFYKIWRLYSNDSWVKLRKTHIDSEWCKAFHDLVEQSTSIVKGNMDIKAINNLFHLASVTPLNRNKMWVVDIAEYNPILFKICGSAQLENTVRCLFQKSKVNIDMSRQFNTLRLKLCLQNTDTDEIIAHNPLVDSFFTLIVAVIMS